MKAAPASAAGQRPMREFSRSLPMQLLRAREAMMMRFRPSLLAHGLSEQQWRVIRALVEEDALEIGELGRRCCLKPASLSRLLPRLEEEGLVARRGHATDQRRVIVSIMAKGRDLFATIAPESEEIYREIAKALEPQRVALLYQLLDEVVARLAPK
jgi:homoprotocatechuate degradation regulator HpaR